MSCCSTDRTDRQWIFAAIRTTRTRNQAGLYYAQGTTSEILRKRGKTDERSILDRIGKRPPAVPPTLSESALPVAIGDDAAVWRPRQGFETIFTCDWFLEGTHFLASRHAPEMVAHKCLARAVSDVAAMGGQPRCFLLSLALPSARLGAWLDSFLFALRAASSAMNCPLAGGDTTLYDEILINITVVGECRRGRAILRSGAQPGDAIFVTGRLGEAEYGWRLLQSGAKRRDQGQHLRKHLFPAPRLGVGLWLAKRGHASAMIDLSDGLSSDLGKLCAASAVGARVNAEALPVVQLDAKDLKKFDATELALHGGDDYELLFTVGKKNAGRTPKAVAGVPVTQIGEITAEKQIVLLCKGGAAARLGNKGWDPFQ
jgi:thiamine-monophosphate kinase